MLLEAIEDVTVRGWLVEAEEKIVASAWEGALVAMGYAIYFLVESQTVGWAEASVGQTNPEQGVAVRWKKTAPESSGFQIILLGYGVDPQKYSRFRKLTPDMGQNHLGTVVYQWDKWTGHEGNWTEENARWCLEFCIDCAFAIQATRVAFPPLVHYSEVFVDKVTASGDMAEFFDAMRGTGGVYGQAIAALYEAPSRNVVLALKQGETATGYVVELDDGSGEVGVLDLSHESLLEPIRFAFVYRSAIEWARVKREDPPTET